MNINAHILQERKRRIWCQIFVIGMFVNFSLSTMALTLSNDYCDKQMEIPVLLRIQTWTFVNLLVSIIFLLCFVLWHCDVIDATALQNCPAQSLLYLYLIAVLYLFGAGCISFGVHWIQFPECMLIRLKSDFKECFFILAFMAWLLHLFLLCTFFKLGQLFTLWELEVEGPIDIGREETLIEAANLLEEQEMKALQVEGL